MGGNFDAIVVLGAGITRKGNLSKVAKSRIDKAIELYRNSAILRIVVTGKNEATAMKDYAARKGVSKTDILVDDDSFDTIGNAFFTKKNFLLPNKWSRMIVVTSIFHVARARFIFRKVLGKPYTVRFIHSRRVLSKESFKKRIHLERGLLIMTKLFASLVADGDMQAIDNFLKSPFYKFLVRRA